jgi:hypothetical protein
LDENIHKIFQAEPSLLLSPEPNQQEVPRDLFLNCLSAIDIAFRVKVTRCLEGKNPGWDLNLIPGEHYRLLAGFMRTLNPKCCIDIGTYLGYSALIMKHFTTECSVHTFDIVNHSEKPSYCLHGELDTRTREGSSLDRYLVDLVSESNWDNYRDLLSRADFIMMDITHDGQDERILLEFFDTIEFKNPPLLFLDDIRLAKMISFWRELRLPKLDLTSFGHWSGTGIVQWRNE